MKKVLPMAAVMAMVVVDDDAMAVELLTWFLVSLLCMLKDSLR